MKHKETSQDVAYRTLTDIFLFTLEYPSWKDVFNSRDVEAFCVVRTMHLWGDIDEAEAIVDLTQHIDVQNLNTAFAELERVMMLNNFRVPEQLTLPGVETTDTISDTTPEPPKAIRCALLFFVPKATRENLRGCLDELYVEVCEEFGEKTANAWYVKECATSLWPQFKNWLVRVGFFSMLLELWHRFTK